MRRVRWSASAPDRHVREIIVRWPHRQNFGPCKPEYVIRIINSLANTKFDPHVVAAMTKVFESGKLRIHRAAAVTGEQAEAAATANVGN